MVADLRNNFNAAAFFDPLEIKSTEVIKTFIRDLVRFGSLISSMPHPAISCFHPRKSMVLTNPARSISVVDCQRDEPPEHHTEATDQRTFFTEGIQFGS
jgi:hypothetical protein